MPAESYRKLSDLPSVLPVFPLAGAILFPRWSLPLNIFEPRYLNMIDDAMAGHRMIGMIQPMGGDAATPTLAETGCAGRITSYSETDDGRYLISLTGICRFKLHEELDAQTPYRQVRPDWGAYVDDLLDVPASVTTGRSELVSSLHRYAENNTIEVDWEAVENAPLDTLISALCAGCPFEAIEKQALLEAETIADRTAILIALLDMDIPGDESSTLQ